MHKPSRELQAAAKAVLVAKAAVETTRPKIHAIQEDLILALSPKVADDYREGRRAVEDEYVTRENAWMMSDEDAERFYPELDKAYREAGFTEIENGQCPLLIAEDLLRKAERLFMEASIELTAKAGFTPEMVETVITCGMSDGLKRRKEYLDLNLRYVVPFIPAAELQSLTQRH